MLSVLTLAALLLAPQEYRATYPLPSLTVPEGLGVNAHFQDPSREELTRIRAAGFRWIRAGSTWSELERRPGVYDFIRLGRMVDRASEAGLRIVMLLAYDNPIYAAGPPTREPSRSAFLRFVQALVGRFRGRGIVWEVWNEPDSEKFWRAKPDAAAYARLVADVVRTIRQSSPDEYVIGPAASAFDWGFLTRGFEHGLAHQVDGVSVHPYRVSPPETVEGDYRRLQSLAGWSAGGRAPAVMCTEWGYADAQGVTDEATQAQMLLRAYLTNLASRVPLTILYNWTDTPGDPTPEYRRYGITVDGNRPKVAYTAIQRLIADLNGARFSRTLPTKNGVRVLEFLRGERPILVGWAVSEATEVIVRGRTARLDTLPRVLP